VLRSRFGLYNEKRASLDTLLETVTEPDAATRQTMLQMAYQTDYGICDHTTTTHPWATLLVHPKEDLSMIDPFRKLMDSYFAMNIFGTTGMTYPEYERMERSKRLMLHQSMVHNQANIEAIKASLKAPGADGKQTK
jgi:hypothetical protein